MRPNHFQFILDSLEVGLEVAEDDNHPSVELHKPHIFADLPPPVSIRAVVILDGSPYEVFVKAAEPGEAHEPEVNHEA
jgi:hypothetical protein